MNEHCAVPRRGFPERSLLAIALLFFLLLRSSAPAQDTMQMRPDYWIQIQDSCWMYRVTASGDTLDPDWFSAMYRYEMLYDSISTVTYILAECKRNGVRLRLPHWKNKRIVNADADLLSFNSRTANFPLHTGDTLSFYREFSWRDPRTNWVDWNTYYANDSLDYAVELVNAADSLRLDLLDSIGVLPNKEPGIPSLHGTRPIFTLVRYVVPSSIHADSAFIRLRLYARGDGAYYFTRKDLIGIGMSQSLETPYWIDYVRRIGGELGKRVPVASGRNEDGEQAKLDVVQAPDMADAIEIRSAPFSAYEGTASIVIFDMQGTAIFYPYVGSPAGIPTPILYKAPRSGTYLVGLIYNGQLLVTRKFTITK